VVVLDELEPVAPDVYRTESGKVRIVSANDDVAAHDQRRDAGGTALQEGREGVDSDAPDCRGYGLWGRPCADIPEDNRLVDVFTFAAGLAG
jgi:hypothetical protein